MRSTRWTTVFRSEVISCKADLTPISASALGTGVVHCTGCEVRLSSKWSSSPCLLSWLLARRVEGIVADDVSTGTELVDEHRLEVTHCRACRFFRRRLSTLS